MKKLYFGWYIVAAGVVLSAFIGGVASYGFTALVNPIRDSLGWSYAQISLAMTLRGMESGVLSPFLGKAVDRWPIKRLVLLGVIATGAGFILLSQVTSLAMFYLSFVVIAFGTTLGTNLTSTASTVRWFKRNLGKANGLLAVGTGLGGVLTPVLAVLIELFTWRTALIIMAMTVLVVGVPLSFLFRSRPEDYGMVVDGSVDTDAKAVKRKRMSDVSYSMKEILRMRAFWLLAVATSLQMLGVGGVMSHVMPYLTSQSVGVDRATAATVAMLFPLVSLPSRFCFGWMCDFVKPKTMLMVSLALTTIGLFAFAFAQAGAWWLLGIFIIAYGLSLGGVMPVRPPLLQEYFGVRNFGSIFGLLSAFVTAGMVTGPPLAGLIYDVRGTYDPIWVVFGSASLVALLLVMMMPLPVRPAVNDTAHPEWGK